MALDLCKYYKKQRFVSYDNGQTWQPLDEYEKGELYEAHSASCGAGVFQYRWVLINDGYICDGKNRYAREIYQYSEDGTVWYNVFPTIYRKGALVESNSPFCDNAGNGQYTSGDTEPTSGDPTCPPNYFWNGTACECNGEVISGSCNPCQTNYKYNKTTHECECQGHFDNNGNCIICLPWMHWNNTEKKCVPGAPDPLKVIKCSDSDGVLKQSDVNYYESGWTVMSYAVGDCIYRIDDNTFNGQHVMTSITISNSVHEVGNLAFANCKLLASLYFPSNITSFGVQIFYNCTNLENVNFGGTVPNNVPSFLFDGCHSLSSANWLSINNITTISDGAFRNCTSLSNITLPQTLTSIGNNAFLNNYSIENIVIPSGVTSIGNSAFSNCTGMTFANINSDNVSIGNSAFRGNTSLTAVTIDSSGITMGSNVFSGCTKLLKLTFTATVPPTIESGDFDNTNECAIFVPCDSVQAYKTAWSEYADRISCDDTGVYYRWVDDPSGVYCDGTDQYTRQKQQSTTNGITWTDTGVYRPITLITHYSEECGYQGEVALTVTNADGFTRYYEPCDSQPPQPSENSKIFATYAYGNIEEKLCDGSTALTSGDTNMSGSTYSKDTMRSAIIGSCVTNIGDWSFFSCISLTSCTIGSGVTSLGNHAFDGCSGLTSVNMPDAVTSIGNFAFDGCSGLTSLTIPDSVTSIGVGAFGDCRGLTSCTIGSGVTTIGDWAFNGCSGLTSVTINAVTPPTLGGTYAFDYTNDCPIYVPSGSVETYKTANRWSEYASRIQAIPNS